MKFIAKNLVEFRPPRIAMSFALVAIAAHVLIPIELHPALPTAATVTGLLGFAIMMRGWWLFRLANTAICPTQRSTYLVTRDIFSVSRNPMYLGMILMLSALALAMGSALFYVATICYGIVMDRVFCPYEERKARLEFGAAYAKYAQRVRRWL